MLEPRQKITVQVPEFEQKARWARKAHPGMAANWVESGSRSDHVVSLDFLWAVPHVHMRLPGRLVAVVTDEMADSLTA